ncbi:MAG: DUF2188 domain-containing protein [Actinomycetota bacterium]
MRGDIETLHKDGKWYNVVEGTDQVSEGFDTKEQAVAEGRAMAQDLKVEHIIKNLDGKIAERNSYGNDPRNIPG